MMTDDQIIAVVQAHKEGKKIQFRYARQSPDHNWSDFRKPFWNFESYEYRVAPESPTEELCPCCGNTFRKCEPREPREWTVGLTPNGEIVVCNPIYYFERVRVREVIE